MIQRHIDHQTALIPNISCVTIITHTNVLHGKTPITSTAYMVPTETIPTLMVGTLIGLNSQNAQRIVVLVSSLEKELAQTQSLKGQERTAPDLDQQARQNHAKSRNAELLADGLSGQNSVFARDHVVEELPDVIDTVQTLDLSTVVPSVQEKMSNRESACHKHVQYMEDTLNGVHMDPAQQNAVSVRKPAPEHVPTPHPLMVVENVIILVMLKK